MEHWQKENVLIKHQEGYKNVRISKHETHVEIDTNTAPFIQAMFKEVAKDIETPCYIRRKFARKGYNIPESSFLEMLRNKFYIGKIRVPAYKGEPEYYVNGEQPGRSAPLREPSPLRTVHESFPSYGSSNSKFLL